MLDRIKKKISKIRTYLGYIEDMKPDCTEKIYLDPIYRGALFHYLYLVSDSSIALAEMVIKHSNYAPVESYHEAIDLLGEKKVIPEKFAYNFVNIASFRNFLAHDYEKVDYDFICDEILSKMTDVERYLLYIEEYLF